MKKMLKIALSLLLILLINTEINCTNNSKTDSLIVKLEISSAKEKPMILNALAETYHKTNPNQAIFYAIEAENIAKINKDITQVITAKLNQSIAYLLLYRISEAINTCKNSIKYANESGNQELLISSYKQLGLIYKEINEFEESLNNYSKSLEIAQVISDSINISELYNLIGSLYLKKSKYPEALKNYRIACQLRKHFGMERLLSYSYYNIALLYRETGEYENAILTIDSAINISSKYSDYMQLANLYNLSGSIFLRMKNFKKAEENYQLSVKIAENHQIYEVLGVAFTSKGLFYKEIGKEDIALDWFKKALEFYQNQDNNKGQLYINNLIGSNYLKMRKYGEALKYYLTSLAQSMELEDQTESVNALTNIGNLYYETGNHKKAIEYYYEALDICLKNKDKQKQATILNHLGNTYTKEKLYDEAIKKFIASYEIREELKDQYSMASILNNIGGVYSDKENFNEALKYYNRSLEIRKKINDSTGLSASLNNIGNIYLYQIQLDKSYQYFTKALDIAQKIKFEYNIGLCSRKIGDIKLEEGQYSQAIGYYQKTIGSGKVLKNYELLKKGYEGLYHSYLKLGNCQKSLEFFQLFSLYRDSINHLLNDKKVNELQIVFDLKQREEELKKFEDEVAELKSEKIIKELQLSRQQNIIYLTVIISILVFILGLLFYNRYKLKQKSEQQLKEKVEIIESTNHELTISKEELQKLNLTKDKFFSIIAHDIKNPLGGIINFTDLMVSQYDTVSDSEKKEMFTVLNKSANQLYSMLENLLYWSKTQLGHTQYKPSEQNLYQLVNNNFELIKLNANKKQILLLNQVLKEQIIWADLEMIMLVLRNLITNAVKYTKEKGQVTVKAVPTSNQMLEISVHDNGIGMSSEEINQLFRMDTQLTKKGTNEETGTGLGLLLCQEFINKNLGKIWVESEQGKGSIFKFTLPTIPTKE